VALVELNVTDTGVGIRAEDQGRLFEPFCRLDAGPAQPEEGSGLGLHLSQRLAGVLGGRITVRSEHERGSTFTLAVPQG
jgi:protein-histidine pros-kinase